MDALNLVEFGNHELATTVEGQAHLFDTLLRARQSSQGCLLRDVRDVAGQMRLQVSGGLHGIGRADHPAQTPSGHRVGLGNTVHEDGAVSQRGNCLDNRDSLDAVVGEVLVDLIGDHPEAVLLGPLTNGLGLLGGVDRTGGVRG